MPNVTLDQIGILTKSAEKLQNLDPAVEKKFPGIKKLLEEIYDTDPSRTSLEAFVELVKRCAESIKDVEKFKATIKPVLVSAYASAKGELLGKDAKLCQALAAVAGGAKGRTGPKEKDVEEYNHIHVGGFANDNLLFEVKSRVVLGRLDFHLETGLNDAKKKRIKQVAGRSGSKVQLQVLDDEVVEV